MRPLEWLLGKRFRYKYFYCTHARCRHLVAGLLHVFWLEDVYIGGRWGTTW